MEIKIFGPGCARCTETENLVKEVAAVKGGNITVQKVTDLKEMMAAGIMSTPAVVIDGVVKSTGKVPSKEEIAAWIDGAASVPSASVASGCGCASATPSCACSPESHPGTKDHSQAKEVVIDFLYLDLNTCERCIATGGTLDEALNTLAPVFQAMNYTVHVNKVNITTKELAEQYRFISSPTIRVNGMDICTEVKESNCKDCGDLCGDTVDCRVFVYEGNAYEQPPAAMLIDGILKVIHGQQPHEDVPYTLPANLQRFFAGKSGGCDSGKSNEGENPMKEINKNEPCCEKISTPASCACSSGACDSGNPVGRKTLKTAICFVVLLAAVSIVGYRTINADNSSKIVPSDTAAFIFGQPAVASTSPLTGQNIGENLESLNALNTVAAKSDAVFVFIPASGADVIDDTIRNAIAEAQLTLIKNNIKVGVYTLSQNSTDFSGIAKQVELPAILVARKGAKAAFISGSNANAKTLLQAYLACCDTSSSSCCPN